MTQQYKHTPEIPPQAILLDHLLGMMKTQAIHVAVQINLADLLKDGSRSAAELAAATGTKEAALSRLLRTLASLGIFEEVEPGYFAQTPLSHLLRPGVPGSMYDIAYIHGERWQWRPWEEFLYSLQTGNTAFDLLFGENLFDYFAKHSQDNERFHKAMAGFSNQVNHPLAQGYDFSSIRTLVDVGGGYGGLLTTILRTYTNVRGVLFDLPHVIAEAEKHIASTGVADRCRLVGGDIFNTEDLPQKADAYIMKQIIKDWDDERAIRILSHCRQAMQTDGRVLVAEQVLLPGRQTVAAKLIDLQLMVVSSGQERDEAQYRRLFEAAGLELVKIWPTHSPYSILEGIAAA
ncbi:MAG: methyltransferase [Ktedonobacteraceae bacterium]|nr:methyltransferase [Ktedonobacteraceae bacterium]